MNNYCIMSNIHLIIKYSQSLLFRGSSQVQTRRLKELKAIVQANIFEFGLYARGLCLISFIDGIWYKQMKEEE